MSHSARIAVLLAVMVLLIVGLDVAFLRNRFGLRLAVNVAIVLVALGVYAAFIR